MQIRIEDLHHTYPGGVEALRGISTTIESGESIAIVGQNGAGKTTLVKHLNGLLQPTRGSVYIGDWNTAQNSVARLAARVGYVFQNPDEQLFCKTVADEVAFGPKNLGVEGEELVNQINYALNVTQLSDRQDTNPYDLSPTWRRMVALASIIAMDTPVVIFDEPTTGQDAPSIARMAGIIYDLYTRGKTVITITHDIDFAAENFSRLIALSQGRILLDGPVEQVIREEETLATTYVDPPQITRLGKRIGLPQLARTPDEFIQVFKTLQESSHTRNGTA